jgi:hypothetical protein
MMEIVCDPNEDKSRRDMFLKECATYTCNKPRYIRHVEGDLPNFNTIEEAEIYLHKLAIESSQQLEPQELATIVRAWIESKRAGQELEIKIINSGASIGEQKIIVDGGLPRLPGTDVIMPRLNGHAMDQLPQPAEPVQGAGADAGGISVPLPHFTALRATPVPPAKILEPTAGVGAMRGHVAGNGPPAVQPPPPLKSQVPQRATDIRPEFRDRYLSERQLRFPHTYQWDGHLWIDSV